MSDQQSSLQGDASSATMPPPEPQGAPAGRPPAPPKKRRGCLVATIAAIVVLVIGIGGTLAFVATASAGKPRDLGVRYTEADYWSALDKAGVQVKGGREAAALGSTGMRYSGSRKLDAVFSSSEVSALLNYSHQAGWPISDAQVRFAGGSGLEISASVEYGGTSYPVYAQGTAGVAGGTVSGLAASAEVMGMAVPSQYLGPGSSYVVGIVNSRLARLGSLDIRTAEVVDGGLRLVGTGPATAEPVPAGQ
jgi:hypothetical protein